MTANAPQADQTVGSPAATENLLEVKDLRTYFKTMDGIVRAVDGISFSLKPGETLGVVGESGCGKSVTALSIMRLHETPPTWIPTDQNQDTLPPDVKAALGGTEPSQILFDGRDLLALSREEMRHVRGNDIAMIFQEPMTSLNPVLTVGDQIAEAVRLHQGLSKKDAWTKAIDSIKMVGINNPERRVKQYPHELSGGMRQRVMIAMAISCEPKLLIADEPTTALDVTIQAQILELLKAIQDATGSALMLITHDLGVIAEMVQNVIVMYAGQIVEQGTADQVLLTPRAPYTLGLIESIPSAAKRGERLSAIRGMVPSAFNLPPACRFEPRCPYAWQACRETPPALYPAGAEGQRARCLLHTPEGAGRGTPLTTHDPLGAAERAHEAVGANA